MPAKKSLPTTSYALLGLLSISPMSGYDLAAAADRSIANFWPISRSQVYGELARLEELGLVRGSDVAQERLPDKRVFEITEAGTAALTGWLAVPGYESPRMRLGFCVKMFFGHHMPRRTMEANLEQFRDHYADQIAYLTAVVATLEALPEAAYVKATALLGLRMAESAKAWAEETLATLPELDHPADEDEHERIHQKARELFERVPPRRSSP